VLPKCNLPRVPDLPASPVPYERTLDGTLGLEVEEAGAERVRGRLEVQDRVRQPYGLVHGGVYAAMAESLASMATAMAVYEDGMIAVGLSNHTSFMRPVTDGYVHAEGRPRHRGQTTWVWELDFTDDDGRLCAISRVTMAVRPR
jgi:1,4-dihydroxy-2-naphthoyl-CoA hydrolase